jgi:hypothetical protein
MHSIPENCFLKEDLHQTHQHTTDTLSPAQENAPEKMIGHIITDCERRANIGLHQ